MFIDQIKYRILTKLVDISCEKDVDGMLIATPLVDSVVHNAKANNRKLAAKAATKLACIHLEEDEKLI